jgi:hypothetical protein
MGTERIIYGRPKLSVDFAIVLRLRDVNNLGWSRMAEEYRRLTGEYVSRDTMKRRYLEAKRQIKDSLEVPTIESIS